MMRPTDHDAPLIQLLSIKQNPLVAEMTQEELTNLVAKLRHQPSLKTLRTTKTQQRQALLDTL